MTIPFVPLFLVLLAAYMICSAWARLDSRYLVAGALALLVATAVVDAGGATAAANTLAEFVFFLLAGGVVLLLIDHLRPESGERSDARPDSGPRTGEPDASEPPQPGQRSPEQSLDGAE